MGSQTIAEYPNDARLNILFTAHVRGHTRKQKLPNRPEPRRPQRHIPPLKPVILVRLGRPRTPIRRRDQNDKLPHAGHVRRCAIELRPDILPHVREMLLVALGDDVDLRNRHRVLEREA